LLILGYSPEMIKNTLATRRDQENIKYETAQQLIQSLLQASWMLGLAGGATALTRTHLLKPEQMALYFSGVAVPIVVGLLLALLVFFPLLRQLQTHQRQWLNYLEMSSCGVMLLQARHHALYLETVLKAYLPPATPSAPAPQPQSAPPPGARPMRSSFHEALKQQEPEEPIDPSSEDPQQALSVDELRRFRPIQRPPNAPNPPNQPNPRPGDKGK
ncbi:MAG: hypothetical protein ACAI44_15650, partial [Candidatus Sericytochromatia bacterium]